MSDVRCRISDVRSQAGNEHGTKSLLNDTSPITLREKLYLLAIGYYRSGDFSRSRDYIERCLEVEPEWRQAQTLKTAIEDRIVKDGVIGVGIAVTAVGIVAGIAAALVRRG
ncbi:hypothetical protein BRARA_J02154 [Brassica rapa]|uniref:Mitochondrial fission 1 protein n=1 Tax=Brassica campestris TaxID=3711 RepID=A0A397XUL5_BRACM|nr:hypothetical protein BRARA_J02154 [Brassica rapa]